MRRRRVSSAPGAGRVRDSTICRMSAAAWWSPAVRRARSSCRATMASVPLPSASAALRARTNRYRGRTPAYPPAASISSSRVVRRLRGSRRTTIGLHRTGAPGGDAVTALAIAAGQGAVALVTGSVLAQFGRALQRTVLLGLLVGVFDFAMYFLQMAVPATELGWKPDIVILALAGATITLLG